MSASHHQYDCTCCQGRHDGPPMSYGAPAPVAWKRRYALRRDSGLTPDQCVVKGEHFFVHGLVEIPVHGREEPFSWGVWVSLSEANFDRMHDLWENPERDREPPYFGWLCTELPVYPESTVLLKTHVHTRAVGLRPRVELEPTDHPLAVEQREGIPLARVHAFADLLLGPR